MAASIDARSAIGVVSSVVAEMPCYIAGSSAATAQPHAPSATAYDDIDLFFSSESAIIAGVQRLLHAGFKIDDRHQRVWHRWLKMGLGKWHTHSLKLHGLYFGTEIEVNCVFKLVDGHPTTSAAQVIESFDFGLLAHAYDCELMDWRDMRSYLFPAHQPDGPLPLLPLRRETWENGFISQYQGLREIGRYVKYVDYGYDMSLVKDDLLTGYWAVADYLSDRDKPEKIQLGKIYEAIALHLSADNLDQLREVGKEVLFMDSLDAIYEALE